MDTKIDLGREGNVTDREEEDSMMCLLDLSRTFVHFPESFV